MTYQWKQLVQRRLMLEYASLLDAGAPDVQKIKEAAAHIIDDIVHKQAIEMSPEARMTLAAEITQELVGFGPIQDSMNDPLVTEIMINGPKKVFIERGGRKELSKITFNDDRHLMQFIDRLLMSTRRRVDESSPYTEIALPNGARVNIIIPPIALDGPTVTIRRLARGIVNAEDLIARGTLDARMSQFLIAGILARLNIIFIGPTGVGKTTTLNVFSSYIPKSERIITIEDTAELQLTQENVVRLEARTSNIEGRGEVSIRDLFKNSLRMRPDRIIIGEIRGGEALDMLQGICSGHTGSLIILHANSPQDAVYRIETMIMSSGTPIGLEAIHRQIAAAINLIVHQEHMADGTRKITRITQVAGRTNEGIILEDIFVYEVEGIGSDGVVQGQWRATGTIPIFFPIFKKKGIEISEGLFRKE